MHPMPVMKIQTVDLDDQLLRVGVRRGSSMSPPLVIFNGIGANLELLEPFVEALESEQEEELEELEEQELEEERGLLPRLACLPKGTQSIKTENARITQSNVTQKAELFIIIIIFLYGSSGSSCDWIGLEG